MLATLTIFTDLSFKVLFLAFFNCRIVLIFLKLNYCSFILKRRKFKDTYLSLL